MAYKKINFKNKITLITSLLLLLCTNSTFATVGGPTIIDRLSYKPSDNSVYYLVRYESGRGCPPIIEKINLYTKEKTEVKSCTEIENSYFRNATSTNSNGYNQLIEEIFKYPEAKMLPIISLPKNNISIIVEYVGEHKSGDLNIGSDFRATVLQDGQKKGSIDFLGCHKDQPNVFKGYIVPETNKMVLKISRIGDCFEGGYTRDSIHVLDNNINFIDPEPVGYYSNPAEAGIYLGSLVVYARNEQQATPGVSETVIQDDKFAVYVWLIPALLAGLVIGFALGFLSRGNR